MSETTAADKIDCGKWKLNREIGRGAYGVVYAATGPDGEAAAVKICRRDADNPERYERELRGAKLYRSVPAGNGLIRLLDLGVCDRGFYMAMELADDEFDNSRGLSAEYRPKTLARVIDGEKALSLDAALKLGITLATGLVTLQRHHLLHRDVKPGNVIYVRGEPVLSDIGLLVEETEAASLVGTPGYVPPENFTGASGDVYSLGLTLKAASFGRSIEELNRGPTLEADTSDPLFPAWWRLLNKATDPDPSRRYHSAKALLKDLCSLRRKGRLSSGSRLASRMAQSAARISQLAFFFLLLFICGVVVWSNLSSYLHRKESERKAAQEVLQEYIDKRSREERANVEKSHKALMEDLKKQKAEIERTRGGK